MDKQELALDSGLNGLDNDAHSDDNNGAFSYTNGDNEETMVSFEFPQVNSSRRTHEDDMYEDLCYVTLRVGPSMPATIWPTGDRRECCIKELVETEKNYIEALNMIVRHFARPLRNIMNSNDWRTIFFGIESLAGVHTAFHSDLFKACSSTNGKISQCFLHWKQRFTLYGDYCANLPRAQGELWLSSRARHCLTDHSLDVAELVDDLCGKNELINQSVQRCQLDANDGKFKLRDLLSLPMQRILKYHLLLNELVKSTPDTHDDYPGLRKAHEAMIDLGHYVNEVKRDSETLEIIFDIQQSITDLDMPENTELKDYGRLLKDGELRMKSMDDTKLKTRYIFVFDKVMLMCKSIRNELYSYKEALILADYKVEDVPTTMLSSASKLMQKDKFNHAFQLVHRQDKSTYTFYAKSEEIKRKWIDAITKAFDNVCPEVHGISDHSFTMYTFDRPTNCSDCDKLLHGIFFQGYKCTVCDFAVHKSCLSTVRSCGAPNLPPRPPFPPPSPFASTPFLEDNHKTSWNDVSKGRGSSSSSLTAGLGRLRALFPFDGNKALGQVSFTANDVIILTKKLPAVDGDDSVWWEGRVERTGDEGAFPADFVIEIDGERTFGIEDSVNLPLNLDFSNSRLSSPSSITTVNLDDYQWFAGSMEVS